MDSLPKRSLIFLIASLILLVILALGGRRYIYLAYQNIGLVFGKNFNNIASGDYVTWIKSQTGDLEDASEGVFLNHRITFVDRVVKTAQVLGLRTGSEGERWIEVNLSQQKLYMREGDAVVGSFLVSTGKWAPTPTGEWRIWIKLRYTRMTGGSKALGTFYDLPNVPYTMFYYQGYSVHGAYWHNNFGQTMSHGCINMRPEEAGIVYNWATVGTRVVVHN